jgi:hypothetical protein
MPSLKSVFSIIATAWLLLPGLSAQKAIQACVKDWQGRPVIFLNGEPQTPLLYALPDVPGSRNPRDEIPQHNIRQFCADGIRMYQVDVWLEDMWTASDRWSLAAARQQVGGILEACPNACVFIRLHTDAPRWWTALHPEEHVMYADSSYSPDLQEGLLRRMEADPRNPVRTSLASEKWTQSASAQIARFCRTFSGTKEGKRVAGIHVAAGVYGEWHQWGFLKWEADFSKPATEQFRKALRQRYKSDQALQKAWQDTTVTLECAAIPPVAQRGVLQYGSYRDPQKDRATTDYYLIQHELVADRLLHFCQIAKENWPRPVITGAFYGYFFSCFNRQAAGGHLSLQKVLRSPWIDYLSGPQAYLPEASKPGEPYRSRSLLLSLRLHGKLWLDEMDQQPRRTFAFLGGTKDQREKHATALSENSAQLLRNLSFAHTKGTGMWLYDFGPAGMDINPAAERSNQHGVAGYWDHPVYHQTLRAFKKMADSTLALPYESGADVLFVYDTEANYYTPGLYPNKDSVSLQLIDYMSLAAYYTGAAFDAVHLDDLEKADLTPYRLVVFANTFVLDSTDRAVIQQKTSSRHVLWCVAPGLTDGNRTDTTFVSAVTGFALRTLPGGGPATVLLDSVLTGGTIKERCKGKSDPLFTLRSEEGIQVVGRFERGGHPALFSQEEGPRRVWWSSVPLTDPASLAYIFRQSGVHLYSSSRNVFYAGKDLIVLHTRQGGQQSVLLKNKQSVSLSLPDHPCTLLIDAANGKVRVKSHFRQ